MAEYDMGNKLDFRTRNKASDSKTHVLASEIPYFVVNRLCTRFAAFEFTHDCFHCPEYSADMPV